MRISLFILWILFNTTSILGQTDNTFDVSQGIITDSLLEEIKCIKTKKLSFYEDEQFVVSKICYGEWGGTIKFKSKKSGIEYACGSTCPVSVNKLDGKYYVANSLWHGSCSCDVIEISNPELMEIYKTPQPREVNGKINKYIGDDNSHSRQGVKNLIREVAETILASFLYNKQLFYVVIVLRPIMTNITEGAYITTIDNGKFKYLKKITNEDIINYKDSDIIKTNGGHTMIPISGGYLDIFENHIKILK